MLRTPLCDLLGIDAPIIQAGMGSDFTSAELAAAVTNAGALGSLGTGGRALDDVRRQLLLLGDLAHGPYAVNHMVTMLDEAAFTATLEARPRVVVFALADAGDLVRRAHDAGALAMQQVCTVAQAIEAAEHGADIIIAQGGESGGFAGTVSTMTLVPQVVAAVRPVPVVAAGGITDGRGLAAALMLGAVGVNVGTRFLSSSEAPVSDAWKQVIVAAASEDAVKVDFWNDISPLPGASGYGTLPRAVKTPFIERWLGRHDEARDAAEEVLAEFGAAAGAGRIHEYMPHAGQSAGAIHDVKPAAEIVRAIVAEAEELLLAAASFVS